MQSIHKRVGVRIAILISTVLLSSCGTNPMKDTESIMKINGQSVVKAEYQMILRNHIAEVKRAYTTKEVNQKEFWTKEGKEGTPLSKLIQLTNEEITHKKILAQFSKEAGIVQSVEYADIMQQCEKRNGTTNEVISTASSLYGLATYGAGDYYDYVYSGLASEVLELLKKKLELPEEKLQELYEKEKAEYISEVSVSMLIGEMRTENGAELAKQAEADMQKNRTQKQLSSAYPDINFYEMKLSTLNTEEGKSGAYTMRWEVASAMQEGDVCEPFQIGDHLFVMKCLQRQEKVAQAYSEVKGILESKVRTDWAKQQMKEKENNAEISFKEEQIEQIALEAVEQES